MNAVIGRNVRRRRHAVEARRLPRRAAVRGPLGGAGASRTRKHGRPTMPRALLDHEPRWAARCCCRISSGARTTRSACSRICSPQVGRLLQLGHGHPRASRASEWLNSRGSRTTPSGLALAVACCSSAPASGSRVTLAGGRATLRAHRARHGATAATGCSPASAAISTRTSRPCILLAAELGYWLTGSIRASFLIAVVRGRLPVSCLVYDMGRRMAGRARLAAAVTARAAACSS